MNRQIISAGTFLLTFRIVAFGAEPTRVDWPDVIQLLTQERSQAEVCAELLKSTGDAPAIAKGAVAYSMAKSQIDGVIGGLTTALVMGGKPADLQGLKAGVDRGAAGLKEVCDSAIKLAATEGGTKGVIEEIAKGAVEPLADLIKSAAGALWTQHVVRDALELETIKAQLEAAKWPDFGHIAPAS